LISVNIWTSPQLIFPLTVTPEGTLIIPTVGEIHVADLTLSEVKKSKRNIFREIPPLLFSIPGRSL
jgi:protein involved in polysaccharide export with SLBB domain